MAPEAGGVTPLGRTVVTTSWDDGHAQDMVLADLLRASHVEMVAQAGFGVARTVERFVTTAPVDLNWPGIRGGS